MIIIFKVHFSQNRINFYEVWEDFNNLELKQTIYIKKYIKWFFKSMSMFIINNICHIMYKKLKIYFEFGDCRWYFHMKLWVMNDLYWYKLQISLVLRIEMIANHFNILTVWLHFDHWIGMKEFKNIFIKLYVTQNTYKYYNYF